MKEFESFQQVIQQGASGHIMWISLPPSASGIG